MPRQQTAGRYRYRSVNLHVLLYGCETRSRRLREYHRLGVLQNTMLGKIFRPKRQEVTRCERERERECTASSFMARTWHQTVGGWTNQRGWHGGRARGTDRGEEKWRQGTGRRPTGRRRCKWDNTKMHPLTERGWGGVAGHLSQCRKKGRALVDAIMNLKKRRAFLN